MSYLLENPFGLFVGVCVLLALFVPGDRLIVLLIGFCALWIVGYGAWWAASGIVLWAWGLLVAFWPLLLVVVFAYVAYCLLVSHGAEQVEDL